MQRSPSPVPARAGMLSRGQSIPAFSLYGEIGIPALEMLHIEEIESRSSLYQWEIDPHLHSGLYQVVWVGQGSPAARPWRSYVRPSFLTPAGQ